MIAAAVALFVLCSLLPIGYLLIAALTGGDGAPAVALLDVRQRGLLVNTASLGVGTALLSTVDQADITRERNETERSSQ